MRKILYLLMLTVLFLSCSSDNDTDSNDDNGNDMIDERILGKWKVEYSKTIKPAVYDEEKDDVLYPADAVITEYMGDFGEPNIFPESGLFDKNEYNIEIKSDNSIIVTRANNNPTLNLSYKIEDNFLKWQVKPQFDTGVNKYRLENGKLIMELIKAEGTQLTYYTISEYSKIKE